MWESLNKEVQRKVVQNAIDMLDNFNDMCFEENYYYVDKIHKQRYSKLNNTEKLFKLLFNLKKFPGMNKEAFKDFIFKELAIVREDFGESFFISSSLACDLKSSFELKCFVSNIMVKELGQLYYNTVLKKELGLESCEEDKKVKKNKKKKRRKKRKNTEKNESIESQKDQVNKQEEIKAIMTVIRSESDNNLINQSRDTSVKPNNSSSSRSCNKREKSLTFENKLRLYQNDFDFEDESFKEDERINSNTDLEENHKEEDDIEYVKKKEKKKASDNKKNKKKNRKNSGNTFLPKKVQGVITSAKTWEEDTKELFPISKKLNNENIQYKPERSLTPKKSSIKDKLKKMTKSRKTKKLKQYNSKIETTKEYEDRVLNRINTGMSKEMDRITTSLMDHAQSLEGARKITKKRINDIVSVAFKREKLFIQEYGSFATKLLTPFSDLDLAIQGCLNINKEQNIQILKNLASILINHPFVLKINPILTATIPVIKLEVDPSKEYKNGDNYNYSIVLKVDIIVDIKNSFDLLSTSIRTTNYINFCIKRYTTFFRNILLIKYGLNCNGLSNSYNGGLNAYGLGILYVAYLESHEINSLQSNFETLFNFLEFICFRFDHKKQSIFFGKNFEYIKTPFTLKTNYETALVINDPSSVIMKNVTHNCFNFEIVLDYFKSIWESCSLIRFSLVKKVFNSKSRLFDEGIDLLVSEYFNSEEGKDIFMKILRLQKIQLPG